MYIYRIEVYEPYSEPNTIEFIQSQIEYSQKEFELLMYSYKQQVIDKLGHMDYSKFWNLLKENGFAMFDFQASVYLK